MADSWEDQGEDVVLQPARPRLRADAPAFTFNPGASIVSASRIRCPADAANGVCRSSAFSRLAAGTGRAVLPAGRICATHSRAAAWLRRLASGRRGTECRARWSGRLRQRIIRWRRLIRPWTMPAMQPESERDPPGARLTDLWISYRHHVSFRLGARLARPPFPLPQLSAA